MDAECSSSELSCGNRSIDELISRSYGLTLFKQAIAYKILVDNQMVGSCMLKLVWLRDEDVDYYEATCDFAALEISYIAIDKRIQRQGIGSRVLEILIRYAREISQKVPVRFLVLDAFEDKKPWYTKFGFKEYNKKMEDPRYPGTIPMRMDLIDLKSAERYCELQE